MPSSAHPSARPHTDDYPLPAPTTTRQLRSRSRSHISSRASSLTSTRSQAGSSTSARTFTTNLPPAPHQHERTGTLAKSSKVSAARRGKGRRPAAAAMRGRATSPVVQEVEEFPDGFGDGAGPSTSEAVAGPSAVLPPDTDTPAASKRGRKRPRAGTGAGRGRRASEAPADHNGSSLGAAGPSTAAPLSPEIETVSPKGAKRRRKQPKMEPASSPPPLSPQPGPSSSIELLSQETAPLSQATEPPATQPPPESQRREPEPLGAYSCPICFSPPTRATVTPCGHVLCGDCLFTAIKTTLRRNQVTPMDLAQAAAARCPVCRATIPGWDGRGGGVIGLKARTVLSL